MLPPQHEDGPLLTSKKGRRVANAVWIVFWIFVVVLLEIRASHWWFAILFLVFTALAGWAESCYAVEESRIRRFGSKEAADKDTLDFLNRRPPYDK